MYLQRKIDIEFLEWKNSEVCKLLLVRGACQIGKARTIRTLGRYRKLCKTLIIFRLHNFCLVTN